MTRGDLSTSAMTAVTVPTGMYGALANEYDLMPAKELADWEAIADTICQTSAAANPAPFNQLRPFL